MAKKRIPKLYVVFDTNVLFTQVASDLVRKDVQRIVLDNSTHPDLSISWFLPKVVIGERKYQMLEKARGFLPAMQKLERLLGHKFGVGEDTLELHVDKAIKDSVDEYSFKVININTEEVDWASIIERSIYRRPPFEPNEKEKGFRDSIIAHSFFQLQKESPVSPGVCRLALVSEDKVLRDYVEQHTVNSSNVRVLSNLDELENLINTLVSTIPEDFAAELANKAGKLFFEKENSKSFYYKENIGEKIREQYAAELNNTILPDHLRSDLTWWILPPIFKKKDKQRIFWVSPVEPEFEIYHFEKGESNQPPHTGFSELLGSQFPGQPAGSNTVNAFSQTGIGLLGSTMSTKKVVDINGRDKFEVLWSANLSQAQNLTSPKLESIQYVGNNINDGNSQYK